MRTHLQILLWLLTFSWLLPASADAQDDSVLVASVTLAGALPESSQAPAQEWVDAWSNTPRLIMLGQDNEALSVDEALKNRLKQLEEKLFSNREWRTYWQHQSETVQALIDSLPAEVLTPEQGSGLAAWKALADDKVANQEVYFEAIESERDAVGGRLESLLEPTDASSDSGQAQDDVVEDPNAYERLSRYKVDLERKIEVQRGKKRIVEAERLFIEKQLATEETLSAALAKDLDLAQREVEIATSQSSMDSGWGQFWQTVQDKATAKVAKITSEVDDVRIRQRSRKVELGLGSSQVDFRDRRIEELKMELSAVSGYDSTAKAIGETFYQWLFREAWLVVLVLILLYFGVRFARRLLERGVKVILKRADDDPDVDDDGDQRRQTLADVFLSVARIAVYIVAGLVALEQVGVNTGPILGSVAILGLAISFGSQNLVRDVVNGFFILLENQYAVGDVVSINGKTGTVEKITIRSTWIRQWTGQLHAVPNGSITLVSNHTRDWAVAVCDVGVAYDSDLEHVKAVVEGIAKHLHTDPEWADQFEDAPSWGGVVSLGDSAITVRLQGKVEAGKQWGMAREMNRRVKAVFEKEGIDIPFPQQVVHHINAPS